MSSGARPKDSGAKSKKKGYYVPSRYKQAAEEISMQSSREKTDFLRSYRDSQDSQLSETISQDVTRSSKCKTSTPISKEDNSFPMLNASSVTSTDVSVAPPHMKPRLGPVDSVKRNLNNKLKNPNMIDASMIKGKDKREKYNEKLAEMELELQYSVYLQSVYMNIKAKKALEARSAIAKESLHKLNSIVLQLLHKYRTQQLSMKILSSLIEIYEHCEKQESILRPIYDIIPDLEEKYKCIAEAVNVAKHRLHLKDAIPPPPGSERDIFTVLQKISEIIKDFMEPKHLELITSAELLKSYVDTAEVLTDALKRGLSSLVDAREKCISEAALALSQS